MDATERRVLVAGWMRQFCWWFVAYLLRHQDLALDELVAAP
jgi:hypothetical protein